MVLHISLQPGKQLPIQKYVNKVIHDPIFMGFNISKFVVIFYFLVSYPLLLSPSRKGKGLTVPRWCTCI